MNIAAKNHNGLGVELLERGRWIAAGAHFRKALALAPDYGEAHANMGAVFQTYNKTHEALHHFQRALQLDPSLYYAMANIGKLCEGAGFNDEAELATHVALQSDPGNLTFMHNLAVIKRKKMDFAGAHFWHEKACKASYPSSSGLEMSWIYTKDHDPGTPQSECLLAKNIWAAKHGLQVLPEPSLYRHDKLRIGFVSADFNAHSAAYAFASTIFGLDRSRYQIHLYSNSAFEDAWTSKFKSVSEWLNITALNDAEFAERVRADEIDMLVDLSGYSAGSRLRAFTARPAPVQLSGWGYLAGSGLWSNSHILLDDIIGCRADYVETIAALPCALSYWPEGTLPVEPAPILKNGHITFGYFGRWSKVDDETAQLWGQILRARYGAKLVLKDRSFVAGWYREKAVQRIGVDASRIIFMPGSGHREHLASHAMADIGLDPLYLNGGVSTLESCWMGVPVVCRLGEKPSNRVAASIMTALGHGDCVAQSKADYAAIAAQLSRLPAEEIAAQRQKLRGRMQASPIANPVLYAAHVDNALQTIWSGYLARRV